MAPVVDGKVLEDNIGSLSATARKVPSLSGFCLDDGADFVFMDTNATSDMSQA